MDAQEYYEELKANHPSHIFEGDDIIRAFDDGIAEGWKQCKEKHWKPSNKQMMYLLAAIEESNENSVLESLYRDLKKLREE